MGNMDIMSPKLTRFKQVTQDQQATWQSLIEQARNKTNNADWEGACIFYKQAFVIAENLMCEQRCVKNCTLNRYLNTAQEFAFVMKQNNFDCALAMFIAQIKENIALQDIKLSSHELNWP